MKMELAKLKKWVDAPKNGVINADKMKNVMDAFKILEKIIDSDATMEIVEGALQTGCVNIEIVARDITVYNAEEFASATKHAKNWQIYPTTDDRIRLDLLFDGVIDYTLDDCSKMGER